ncbi:NACHT domain-containing protein [Saccharothrix saharensis]|uniref:NACHT domain-containing protein n=1 Tax=Saccharothrix saharensis TaxID=571190 RepID=A0A543JC46_9PSEU|nr:NACHT domain-containing protein [Saccharothrix saharensis]TQM80425.1 NACHT domain-containing protein [Saccharothrix saharensis]
MTGIEAAAGRTAATAGSKLFGAARRHWGAKKTRDDSRTLTARRVADDFLASLDGPQAESLLRYLRSPDFEEVALQLTLWRLLRDREAEKIEPTLREEIRLGLRHAADLRPEQLTIGADVVLGSLLVAVQEETRGLRAGDVDTTTAAGVAHLVAAAASNTQLLGRTGSLAGFHQFGELLRSQVAQEHAVIRMPHLGLHRSVPYSELYVQPSLQGLSDLTSPGRRSVILGDPGAGKSTLAAKLARDIAIGDDGRVPLMLVLRNFTASFREGGRGLAWYLAKSCQEPYNVTPPEDAIEYLLGNGRAVVILDGVDELVEPELRERFARLVESFTRLYPLVPVVVTARKIGYTDAPLDSGLFSTGTIKRFDDDQVRRYARNWFALSETVAERERPAMADAFFRESESVGELRANPLLLALLCNMYAHEHYIPNNLAQVYEKCAVMLFEQWDRRRGLTSMPRFQGRLRSAVGYLAWQQFTAESSGVGWPRGQVVRMLTTFLEHKEYRPDEAEEEAERFVDFCSGRPWVLTDIGGGATEARYGFAHRTFMEYFAAEHLVRTHPTPEELWSVLAPEVVAGQWEVVAQIALQLLDQHRDDGASEVLRLVVQNGDTTLLDFAARTLGYLVPTPGVLRSLVEALVRAATSMPVESLFLTWHGETRPGHDTPLLGAAYHCLPANEAVVHDTITAVLRELASQGNQAADVLWYRLGLAAVPMAEWPFTSDDEDAEPLHHDLGRALSEFGPKVAYMRPAEVPPLVETELDKWCSVDPQLFIDADLPWISDKWWWFDMPQDPGPADDPDPEEDLAEEVDQLFRFLDLWGPHGAELLLQLPDLETYEQRPGLFHVGDVPQLMFDLVHGRKHHLARRDALRTLEEMGVPEEVRDFLDRWMRREFNVIG